MTGINYLRLANLIQLTSLKDNQIRDLVWEMKLKTSFDKECGGSDTVMYYKTEILSLVLEVEQELGFKSSELRFKNITEANLKTAAEIFIFLSICPGEYKKFMELYQNIFQTNSPEKIILTLNRMMKGNKPPDNNFHTMIFQKTSTLFSAKYVNFEDPFQRNVQNDLKSTGIEITVN